MILEPATPVLRGERLSKLIEVAVHLTTLNNYSTLMSVIAGLNKACIARLGQTFKEVPAKLQKRKNEIEKLMSPESSYKSYRSSIHSISPPCIPYIGTYLTDCTPRVTQ